MKTPTIVFFVCLFILIGFTACENERIDPLLEESIENPLDNESDEEPEGEEEGSGNDDEGGSDGSGDGNNDGNGDGGNDGSGDGNNDGNGDGGNDGSGDGNNDGSGDGNNDGNGDGGNDGSGDGGNDGNGDGNNDDSGDGNGGDGNNDGGDGMGDGNEPTVSDYFPLTTSNQWNYNVDFDDTVNNETFNRSDSYSISGTTTINGLPYYTITAAQPASGIMTNIFDNSSVRMTDDQLFIDGSITFPAEGLEDFEVNLSNIMLYDKAMANGTVLSTFSDTYEQVIDGGITLTFDYIVESVQGNLIDTAMANGVNYEDVITSTLTVFLRITASGTVAGIPITLELLKPKDVLVIKNMYANAVGLISSNSTLDYQLEDFSSFGVNLPYNETVNVLSTQVLSSATLIEN